MDKAVEHLKQLWEEEKINAEITLEVLRESILQFPKQKEMIEPQIKKGEARQSLILKKLKKLQEYE